LKKGEKHGCKSQDQLCLHGDFCMNNLVAVLEKVCNVKSLVLKLADEKVESKSKLMALYLTIKHALGRAWHNPQFDLYCHVTSLK